MYISILNRFDNNGNYDIEAENRIPERFVLDVLKPKDKCEPNIKSYKIIPNKNKKYITDYSKLCKMFDKSLFDFTIEPTKGVLVTPYSQITIERPNEDLIIKGILVNS